MSGPPRVKSMNVEEEEEEELELESRPVLGPAGNKARSMELKKPVAKPKTKVDRQHQQIQESKLLPRAHSDPIPNSSPSPPQRLHCGGTVPSILKKQDHNKLLRSNLSLNASCSSDASSDSSHSRASTGKISGRSVTSTTRARRKQQCGPKSERVDKAVVVVDADSLAAAFADASLVKKRCAWVTPTTDPCYAAFHDEEWGVPVRNDRKLFELLSLSTALAELTWPAILSRRHIFKEVFQDFDPITVSKLNERKIVIQGSLASSLLSELKLRAIIENACQICKIIDELGSFEKYIWSFVGNKPIVGNFRYPRQVPIKTSKADAISKDLVRRGFRGVGPTVVYSFMQVAGLTNDHLISCFRFQECIDGDASNKDDVAKAKVEGSQLEDGTHLGLIDAADDLILSTE